MNVAELFNASLGDAIRELARRGLDELEGPNRSAGQAKASEIDLAAIRGDLTQGGRDSLPANSVAAVASVVGGAEIFRIASRRVRTTFRLNLFAAISLIVTFVGSLIAAVVASLATHNYMWAVLFGGVTIVDLAGLLVANPLSRMDRAMIVSNLLDILHIRYIDATATCEQVTDIYKKTKCLDAAWTSFRKEIERVVGSFGASST